MDEKIIAKVDAFIASQKWTFAKTMPECPHWYIVRAPDNEKRFSSFVKFIREHGVKEKFGKTNYTYFYRCGYKYWTMGIPIEKTIIINRAEIQR